MTRTQIFKRVKGHVSQYEDWWYLVEEDDGSIFVEHEWDHVTVNGLTQDTGTKRDTVDEFLQGSHYYGAQAALKEHMQKSGAAKIS